MPRFVQSLLCALFLLLMAGSGSAWADNPFGIMLWPTGEDPVVLLARARALGIAWYRPPAVFLDRWKPGAPCPSCTLYNHSGLRLALTVRNGGRDFGTRLPSTPPTDIEGYKKSIASVLEAWKPNLLVVEDEENTPALFTDSSPGYQAYSRELEAACATAHAHQIACTNGGLTSDSAAALTWLNFLERGKVEQACEFARGVFYTEADPQAGAPLCAYKTVAAVPAEVKENLLRGADRLLALYRASAVDAVNFHWYIHDARALAEVVEYLGKATGKPLVSNEMGQWRWDAEPSRVRPLLRASFAAQMQVVIWYSIDTANAASLFEPDGRLRPGGWEFQRQIRGK